MSPTPSSITATCESAYAGAWNSFGRNKCLGFRTVSAGHGKSSVARPVVQTQTRSPP